MSGIVGPHQSIQAPDRKARFVAELFDLLWDGYRGRVSYVGVYEQLVAEAGARFLNDHIAFRTIATQRPMAGIATLARIFEALGYRAAGVYDFADKHLNAIHYRHPHPDFPKLFISELKSWELSVGGRQIVERVLADQRAPISGETLSALATLDDASPGSPESPTLLTEVAQVFCQLPWHPPEEDDLRQLHRESQYGAWVLVHGYEVNHFTSLVNSHGVDSLDNLEKTIEALRARGVPTKSEIEGEPGSKLRQSATEAVVIDVAVRRQGNAASVPWTYAYFELAERNWVTDPTTGKKVRFEAFLGPQATHLFEMTRVREKEA